MMILAVGFCRVDGQNRCLTVADSLTHAPLSNASVFNHKGDFLGISDKRGSVSCTSAADYPLTIRYMGYTERSVSNPAVADTLFLSENFAELPEVIVEGKNRTVLHILAYAREYSTLTSYTDTVTMFREKMIDFMLPDNGRKSGFKGWKYPRVLNSRSYYRFSDINGLDSVSDRWNNHFTWSDWVGISPDISLPPSLAMSEIATDTLRGKYSPAEIWMKSGEKISVNVDVLADTVSRKWVPGITTFFDKENMEFDNFRLRLNYSGVLDNQLSPLSLSGYSFNVESRGRGREMFHFRRYDQPFFVTTYTEVYIIDKEFITLKEARKWEKMKSIGNDIEIFEPEEAPALDSSTLTLIARVKGIDDGKVRSQLAVDHNLVNRNVRKGNFGFGYRALSMLKLLTGITHYKSEKNVQRNWKKFRDDYKKQKSQNDSE